LSIPDFAQKCGKTEITSSGIFKYALSGNHFGIYNPEQNKPVPGPLGSLRVNCVEGMDDRPIWPVRSSKTQGEKKDVE
jgi:hypothetical protein